MKKLVVIISLMFTYKTVLASSGAIKDVDYYRKAGFIDAEAMINPTQTSSNLKPSYESYQPAEIVRKPITFSSKNWLYRIGKSTDVISNWAWAPAFIGLVGMTYAYGLPVVGNFGLPSLLATGFLKVFRDNFNFSNDGKTRIEKRPYTYNGKEMELTSTATVFIPKYTVTDTDKNVTKRLLRNKRNRDYLILQNKEQEVPGSLAQQGIDFKNFDPKKKKRVVYNPTKKYINTTLSLDLNKISYAQNQDLKTKEDYKEELLREQLAQKHPIKKPELNIQLRSLVKHGSEESSWQFVVPPHKTFPAKT